MFNAFTGSESRQDCWFLVKVTFGDKDGDRLPYYLVGVVAEYALRAPIPAGTNSLERRQIRLKRRANTVLVQDSEGSRLHIWAVHLKA